MRGAVDKVRPGITLAKVELEVLCRLLDSTLPPGVAPALESHAVRDAALACLAARGIVGCAGPDGDDGGGSSIEVHDAVARTVRLAARCRSTMPCAGEMLAVGVEASVFVRHGDLGVVRLEPVANAR